MRKKLERKRISQRRWLAEKYRRDNRCHYCGSLTYLFDGPLQATVDHKVPQSVRRWNHWTNYALACLSCNQEKGSLDYEAFRKRKSGGDVLRPEAIDAGACGPAPAGVSAVSPLPASPPAQGTSASGQDA